MPKFKKILIANRGEIAVRVIRACRDMGIRAAAVYSDADRDALHVRMSDEAYHIGPSPSAESYLRGDKIIRVAHECGADAIHPGYGFLSENSGFVNSVIDAGLIFIGPPPKVMEDMGGKISARKIAERAGVPVVPGTNEPLDSVDSAMEAAREIGLPVMLKASAGGGGKGMRLIRTESELASAFKNARSEAKASFGDDSVYLEKAIIRPRHIEIQIFSDSHDNHVHLGERECSIQRRHQKVVEESPSPINDAKLREQMGEAAVCIARAVKYVGAGTVEFLVSDVDRSFYFLEMNTRLQVEHPVTELVTGIDLVREQICVAAGEPLSFSQESVKIRGHAIECRVYAEDPANGYMPSPGKISRLRVPRGPGVRDDGGVCEGDDVTIHYDPMISKLCTFGRNREEAIDRMQRALSEYFVGGIKTTLPLFRLIMRDEVFRAGKLDTGFLDSFAERAAERDADSSLSKIALTAAALSFIRSQDSKVKHAGSTKEGSARWNRISRNEALR